MIISAVCSPVPLRQVAQPGPPSPLVSPGDGCPAQGGEEPSEGPGRSRVDRGLGSSWKSQGRCWQLPQEPLPREGPCVFNRCVCVGGCPRGATWGAGA